MQQTAAPPALIIAGPTAAGKSALALAVARRHGGVIINADAMQCYADLAVLTARPAPAELQAAPHRLYGVRDAAQPVTAAWWRDAALQAMAAAHASGQLPILCGGSGMYLNALIQGLADIPDAGPAARAQARQLLAELGPAGLHARLREEDPQTAARLRPSDPQRLARAWEVLAGTGRGLADWQQVAPEPAPWRFAAILLNPPRPWLRARIAARFDAMLRQGALEEVRALSARALPPDLPLLRAHGVPELAAHLRGEITLAAAAEAAVRNTCQYTRRQATWLRHHRLAPDPHQMAIIAETPPEGQFLEEIDDFLVTFWKGPG